MFSMLSVLTVSPPFYFGPQRKDLQSLHFISVHSMPNVAHLISLQYIVGRDLSTRSQRATHDDEGKQRTVLIVVFYHPWPRADTARYK